MKSTPAMRARIRELATPPKDDFDRAVLMVVDDLEATASVNNVDVEAWIAREFTGHGMAVRQRDDPPIPGEPLMSMATAKELVRRAVAEFATLTAGNRGT